MKNKLYRFAIIDWFEYKNSNKYLKIIDYKNDLTKFYKKFKRLDTKKVWDDLEIVKLFNYQLNTYGEVTDENTSIEYAINNKESVDF